MINQNAYKVLIVLGIILLGVIWYDEIYKKSPSKSEPNYEINYLATMMQDNGEVVIVGRGTWIRHLESESTDWKPIETWEDLAPFMPFTNYSQFCIQNIETITGR